jgi:hypothetical protein
LEEHHQDGVTEMACGLNLEFNKKYQLKQAKSGLFVRAGFVA